MLEQLGLKHRSTHAGTHPATHPLALGCSWITRIVRSLRDTGAMAVLVKDREAAPVVVNASSVFWL